MSLKPVEMQIAIPRTNEATAVQNQLSHKPLVDQQQLADQTIKKADHSGQRANQVDAAFESKIRDDRKQKGGHGGSRRNNSKKEEAETPADRPTHPFKGHHIDLSL